MKIIIIPILFLAYLPLQGQEVIATGGKTDKISDYSIDWTIGETIISTGISGELFLTQGLHQPRLSVTTLDKTPESGINFNVFPNPTSDILHIHSENFQDAISISLHTLSGKLLMKKAFSTKTMEMSLHQLPSGTYFLKIFGKKQKALSTFKILKM